MLGLSAGDAPIEARTIQYRHPDRGQRASERRSKCEFSGTARVGFGETKLPEILPEGTALLSALDQTDTGRTQRP
jgi:hypothetical protein